jgi:hypothetical protein
MGWCAEHSAVLPQGALQSMVLLLHAVSCSRRCHCWDEECPEQVTARQVSCSCCEAVRCSDSDHTVRITLIVQRCRSRKFCTG